MLPPEPDLNHGVQTGQDVRCDFAGHGDEIAHREPKARQRMFCPAALLRCEIREMLQPVRCMYPSRGSLASYLCRNLVVEQVNARVGLEA